MCIPKEDSSVSMSPFTNMVAKGLRYPPKKYHLTASGCLEERGKVLFEENLEREGRMVLEDAPGRGIESGVNARLRSRPNVF